MNKARRFACPNCTAILTVFISDEKIGKVGCSRCGTRVILKEKGRAHDVLDVYAPKNEKRIDLDGNIIK